MRLEVYKASILRLFLVFEHFVPAVAHHFYLNLFATFSQPVIGHFSWW